MGAAHTPAAAAALGDLVHLERRAYSAATIAELGFTIVNETSVLAPYRQAALFRVTASGGLEFTHASGLVSVSEETPYAVWLSRLARSLDASAPLQALTVAAVDAEFAQGWREWLPAHLLACNLFDRQGERIALVLYAREAPWSQSDVTLIGRIHEAYAYCHASLTRTSGAWRQWGRTLGERRWTRRIGIAAAMALLVPVRLSAIAPAEIVALTSTAIASPQDGVVGTVHVQPNAAVKAGDRLFSLDDRGLESRRNVAERALQVARADLLLAEQRAFDDQKGKGELAAAQGRVREKEAELQLVAGTLDRVTVRAPADGVVIFGDPNDWLGRPVQTGERIMQLADPRDAGVMVWLPASDAINLEFGAPIRLFLNTQPLSPLTASLVETSYQPVQSPSGVSSYRIRGRFEAAGTSAGEGQRIGLRGTARVSGDWTCLGYYLLRRPIAAAREWTGL